MRMTQFGQWIKTQSFVKKILMIVAVLLFLSPTFFAIVYTIQINHASADFFSVTLYSADGQPLVSEEGDPKTVSQRSVLGIFYRISTFTEPMAKAPARSEDDPYVLAECVLNGTRSQWKCYFSSLGVDSYCISENGTAYAIDKTLTKNFLSTEYAEAFYQSATPPTLQTIDQDTVLPCSVNWYYQSQDGKFSKVKYPAVTSQNILYDLTGTIHIEFERSPDICEVSVYNKEEKLFEGDYTELSTLTVDLGSILDLSVHAEWLPSAKSTSYGSVEYEFSVQIRNQSEFSIHTDTVSPGEFLILSCTNISDLSKIKFTPSQQDIIPTPVFHQDGTYVRALLAFPEDITQHTFSFSVSYGASEQSFSVNIVPSASSESFRYPDWTADASLMTDVIKNTLSSIMTSLPKYNQTPLYFRGRFGDPTSFGWSVGYTQGSSVWYGKNASECFVAFGSAFKSNSSNNRVLALHHGVIVTVDFHQALGNFVVIDHGGGLRTWYCHLENCNVEEGTVVKQGDLLGRVGNNAISDRSGILIFCTLYDTILNPSCVIGKEFYVPTA